MNIEEQFATIVASLQNEPDVAVGGRKKGFGSAALRVGDKIFAMISSKGSFVVKLPRTRVDALEKSGVGTRFEPAPGRVMKEWAVIDPAAQKQWLPLAREAMKYVGGMGAK